MQLIVIGFPNKYQGTRCWQLGGQQSDVKQIALIVTSFVYFMAQPPQVHESVLGSLGLTY